MNWLKTGLLTVAVVFGAVAHAFPTKPVRIVVGFPAGGPLDQHVRLLADKLQANLGQPIVIDYKAGAGGIVGAQDVMKSPPDGHTLMLANTGVMVINPALYSKLPYSTTRDFVPIARTAMQPLALLVNPKVPANTLKEFIDYARARPGLFGEQVEHRKGIARARRHLRQSVEDLPHIGRRFRHGCRSPLRCSCRIPWPARPQIASAPNPTNLSQ